MPQGLTRILINTLLLVLLFAFSGCTVSQDFAWLNIPNEESDAELTANPDPDLKPVDVESEICLDQELEALALTGSWDDPQSLIDTQTLIEDVDEEEITYDFPVVLNRQVEMYISLFQGKQREFFASWLSRSGRYLPMIESELEKADLPLDLAYLSLIESGFSQRAYSRSSAVGLWQFMEETGRDYGLSNTRYIDERRDALKSTRAAVAYLKDLYEEFDDWYLAVAAYNGGPGTIRRAIRNCATDDFWQLAQKQHLPLETKRYVPKLIAAIMIAKDPESYGFTDINYEDPLAYDNLTVGPGLSLDAVALLSGADTKVIKQLNQELKTGKTPLDRERYQVKIPAGTKTLAEKNLPRLHSVVGTDYKTHIVGKNETLAGVCRYYNINTTTLLKVNNLKSSKLAAGSRLRIPFRTIQYRILPEGVDTKIAAGEELILHTVKKGETISKISRQYQVPVELIVSWNGLSSAHKISIGQQLALYLNSNDPDPGAAVAAQLEAEKRGTSVPTLAAEHKAKKNLTTIPPKKDTIAWYQVKSGDSLWTISQRFNTSPASIKKMNNLKTNLIHPGSRLKVRDV